MSANEFDTDNLTAAAPEDDIFADPRPAPEEDTGLDPDLLAAVEIQTEPAEGRQRRLSAKLFVPYSPEQLWQILTAYESLADFIPNLASSRLVPHPEGGIRLEQVGTQRLMRLNFSARVVLDMTEEYPHAIRFNLVEGDFKGFSGAWLLDPHTGPDQQAGTLLGYKLLVWPKRTMPIAIIEPRIRRDLAINLVSIYQQAQKVFQD